jgi:hypothetical protein
MIDAAIFTHTGIDVFLHMELGMFADLYETMLTVSKRMKNDGQ